MSRCILTHICVSNVNNDSGTEVTISRENYVHRSSLTFCNAFNSCSTSMYCFDIFSSASLQSARVICRLSRSFVTALRELQGQQDIRLFSRRY